MRKLLLIATLVTLLSCTCQNTSNKRSIVDSPAIDAISYSATNEDAGSGVADDATGETLNDIRFAGWTKKEWADNEYIREVRRYIDAYNKGEITDAYLDDYKEYIQGKFAIADIQPYIAGGALIYIIFYDNLEKTFSSVVYSSVNEETRVISNYECKGLKLEDYDLGFSQEDIQQFLKECPEQRLW